MELGEKLRLARTEAGLSQRQLCEGIVTRNMLSLIEHGNAQPSMETLRALASRLEKPLSWFLDEDAVISVNQNLMQQAEDAYANGSFAEVLQILQNYQAPDRLFDRHKEYLYHCALLEAAKEAAALKKNQYARQLLETDSWQDESLLRSRLLLLSQLPGGDIPSIVCQLPSLDNELLLRAQAALAAKQPERSVHLLNAMENHALPSRALLLGKALTALGNYSQAVKELRKAEETHPEETAPLLEICWRELGDYQKAYTYACKQKK